MSPRAKFISKYQDKKLAAEVWDIMKLASTHDPDHAKELCELRQRIEVLERQTYRLGAPQYRTIRRGNTNIHVQRVRKVA